MTTLAVLPLVIILIVVAAIMIYAYHTDKVVWNNDIYAKSGEPWVLVDCDSRAGRYYTDNHGNDCWITYYADKVK